MSENEPMTFPPRVKIINRIVEADDGRVYLIQKGNTQGGRSIPLERSELLVMHSDITRILSGHPGPVVAVD